MNLGDYPAAHTGDKTREAVRHQVDELEKLGNPENRDAIFALIQNGRKGQPGLAHIDRDGGVIHVVGEILVDRNDLGTDAVKKMMQANALKEADVGDQRLKARIARLVTTEGDSSKLRQAVTSLRGQNANVALNYVLATAAVGKSGDTPEPVDRPSEYRDYPIGPLNGGVPVGIIDTGVTDEVRWDGWLAGVRNPPSEIDPLDKLPPPMKLDVAAGHGTHIAGIIQQIAPGATIRVYKALATDGIGSDLDVANVMLRAVDDGCRILSLSLGCTPAAGPPPMAIANALDLISDEVLIVAAAGNDGNEDKVYPAAWAGQPYKNVVSVAGLTAGLKGATWSSRGSWVTASAIAEGIRSTFVKGEEPKIPDESPDIFFDSAWAVWAGTSFSAPQIAGAVARICQLQPGTTPRQAWDKLRLTGTPIPDYGKAFKILPAVS